MTASRPDLEDLAMLTLVAETGSIGEAAARLGISQPSASRRMTSLERSLRISILQRSRRGTTLTPAGRVVVDWASSLLSATDEFTHLVQLLRVQGKSNVRAAVSMTIAEYYAPAWLGLLRRQHPDSVVSLTVANSTDVAELVHSGKFELGFLESPTVQRGLRTRRVGYDDLVVAVSPGHPWARRETISCAELSRTALLVREEGSGTRETVEGALSKRGLELTPGQEMASNTALKLAAVAGAGPVVVSARALANELQTGALVEVMIADLSLTRPLTAVWQRDTELSAAAAALLTVARK